MSNHRPKSLSELNNVYDKALRAEKAIKEGSTLLKAPDSTAEPETNIFRQLETKTAEVHKNQVFDPDITNIANDFLKRYAQPEKPKPAPTEIKRPAPAIQSVQHHMRKTKAAANPEAPVSQTPQAKPSMPLHRPSGVVPPTESVIERTPDPVPVAETAPVIQTAPVAAPEIVNSAPAQEIRPQTATVRKHKAVRTAPAERIDHTPKPTPSRRRISSTERSELMEEYLRVMSDEDDEPSEKKSVFSFFRKKKADDYDEPADSIYEDFSEEEPEEDNEVPVVAFDSSDVRYTDEYSELPVSQDTAVTSTPMNLYDYIEADFDYDEDDDTLDISTTTFEKQDVENYYDHQETPLEQEVTDEIEAEHEYTAEAVSEELSTESTQETPAETAEELPEEIIEEIPEESAEEIVEIEEILEEAQEVIEEPETTEAEVTENTEATESPEETAVYEEDAAETAEDENPATAEEIVFEDIFSVSDESKRSHTGGDWSEIVAATSYAEPQPETENSYEGYDEYAEYDEYNEDEFYDDDEEYDEKKKGNILLKIVLVFFALVSLTLGALTVAADMVLDIDSGNLISDSYRLFCADADMPSLNIGKGDLIITNNAPLAEDDVYVFINTDTDCFDVGRIVADPSTPIGDYLIFTQTETKSLHVDRDNSLGVVIASYGALGTVLSLLCNYSTIIAVVFLLIAVGLIVLLIVTGKRKADDSKYDEYDDDYRPDSRDDSDRYESDDSEGDDDEEYYSEYDTDGIEQGLFTGI